MFPQELASLSFGKFNEYINAEAKAEHDSQLIEDANEAATVVFEGFRRLGERQRLKFRNEFDGIDYIGTNYDTSYGVHQDGIQTITFRQPAPELGGIAIPGGYIPQKQITLARHMYSSGFGLEPRKKVETFDWAVRTTLGLASEESPEAADFNNYKNKIWPLWGLSFIEYIPDRERAANSLLGYKEDLMEHRIRGMQKSTSEIVAGMLFSLDLAKEVLEAVKTPSRATA